MKVAKTYISSFISECQDIFSKYITDQNLRIYYRGEEKDFDETRLLPSAFRGNDEKEIYYKYLRRHPEEFKDLSNLDILAKMQHYFIPTRLLDLTTNPLVALFFACGGFSEFLRSKKNTNQKEDGYVYILLAKKKNILTYDSDRALLLSTLSKMDDSEKFQIKHFIANHYEDRVMPEHLYENETDSIDIKAGKNAFSKYVYECERERDAFKDHKVLVKDLSSIFYVKSQFSSIRMKLQNSLFMLFGMSNSIAKTDQTYFNELIVENSDTYDEESELRIKFIKIKIPASKKKQILAELKFYCEISYSSLFEGLNSSADEDKKEIYEYYKSILRNEG